MERLAATNVDYTIRLNGTEHHIHDVHIRKDETPVRGPTSRGGVYTEQDSSYRIVASVDSRLEPHLSATMLGPSAEFGNLTITARYAGIVHTITCSILSMSRSGGSTQLRIAVAAIS